MVEFNPDGSLRLPAMVLKRREENNNKLRSQRCINIKKEVVSFTAPKKCALNIILSDAFNDNQFVTNIFNYFKEKASTPCSIKKVDEKNFIIEIGTDFKRCTDCTSLIKEYREFLFNNVIEEKGSCTFEGRKTDFSYEDYF